MTNTCPTRTVVLQTKLPFPVTSLMNKLIKLTLKAKNQPNGKSTELMNRLLGLSCHKLI